MFKFITNYFKERKKYFKECDRLIKMRDKISGLERLVKYHKKVIQLTDGEKFCPAHIILDVIDTLEDHEKRINILRSLDRFRKENKPTSYKIS